MPDVDTPSVSLHEVLKLRRKYREVLQAVAGQTLTAGIMAGIAQAITAVTKTPQSRTAPDLLGESGYDVEQAPTKMTEAVYRMLAEESAGQPLTDELVDYLSLRFAGNFVKCRASTEPRAWRGQNESSWVIAEVVDTEYHVTPARHIPGAVLTFLVWSGSPAGKTFTQFFTDRSLSRMAIVLGLMLKFKRRTLHHREFVRLKMLLNLKSVDGTSAVEYNKQGSLNNRNKHRALSRRDKTGCKREIDAPCHFCPVSYKSCVNGTHPQDYSERMCIYGHKGWFAPGKGSTCLKCQASRWWTSHH